MKKLALITPVVAAASILALSGVATAQNEAGMKNWIGGRNQEMVASGTNCPQIKVTQQKIDEDQAWRLAQQYADKNMTDFQVVRPLKPMQPEEDGFQGAPSVSYGGGYNTVCYKSDSPATGRYQAFYSVEYSVDTKNPAGDTRNLRVDQFGHVTEFSPLSAMAGERGPAGPQGPAGPMGAQGPAGPAAIQSAVATSWSSFRDFLFSFDQSAIRANETSHITDIASYMKQNPSAQVGIDGHTDPRGTDAYNQSLSERRVNTIRAALVAAGVAEGRIKAGAFGESRPKCSEPTEPCWQADRRVEVLIGNAQTTSR